MELVWRILPSVRPGERDRFVFFLGLGAALALAQTVGTTAAESLFLSRVGPAALPLTFVFASLVTTAASFLYAIRIGQALNDDVLIELLAIFAAIAAILAVGARLESFYVPTALLCVQIAAQAILINHLGELTGDCFDRLAAKRVTPLLTAGLSLGAAAGGGLALVLSRRLPSEALVGAWSILLLGILVWLRLSRNRVRRWAPLGLEEDAHSLDGVRAAARYLRHASLGRLLLLSAVLMILTVTVTRFLYSEVFAQAYPDERELAGFLATYLALTNLAQVALPLWLVPWLIARLGVPTANLIHPILSFGFSIGLFASQQLPAAIGARVNVEVVETSLAGPVRNLMNEALPQRLSARAGAFLGGVVVQGALSLAGGALLLLQHFQPAQLALLGGGLSLAYLLAHLRLRRAYMASLVEELRAGRLDLGSISGELGRGEVSRLAGLWENLVHAPDERSIRALVELAPFLAARGFEAPLLEALDHPNPTLRSACIDALASGEGGYERIPGDFLTNALRDVDPRVRLAALRALPADAEAQEVFREPLRELQRDAVPDVAAAAAAHLGAEGEDVLRGMVLSEDPERALAGIDALPASLAELARGRLDDGDRRVRAAVLACAARHPESLDLAPARLVQELTDTDLRVRAAAARALAASPDPASNDGLADALRDPAGEIRSIAVRALVARGTAGEAAARRRIEPGQPHLEREAALEVLYRVGSTDGRAVVTLELRQAVREAWRALLALRVLPEQGALALRWLRAAESDSLASALRLAFRILSLLEDATVTRAVERTLRFGPERLRFEALEVLSHLGEREAAAQLVLLLEPSPLEEKLSHLGGSLRPPRSVEDVIESGLAGGTHWLRLAAHAASRSETDSSKESLMERLVFLRGVTLFSNLSLDQLEAVERITREEPYVEGERVVQEGDPGEDLYLVMEGELEVWRHFESSAATRLNTLGPGSYFGEMSIFDNKPRSASVVTRSRSRVLVLEGERLRDLILEQPEIAFEMFRVLTARVRAAEARLPG
jgi:HEAT repeat protein